MAKPAGELEKVYGQFDDSNQLSASVGTTLAKLFFKTFLFTIFMVTGASKLIAGQLSRVIDFENIGVPQWVLVCLGSVEICAAALIIIPQTSLFASSMLCLVLLGATGTNIFTGEILRALITAGLFGVSLWLTLNESMSGALDLELDKDFKDDSFAVTDESRHENKSA